MSNLFETDQTDRSSAPRVDEDAGVRAWGGASTDATDPPDGLELERRCGASSDAPIP